MNFPWHPQSPALKIPPKIGLGPRWPKAVHLPPITGATRRSTGDVADPRFFWRWWPLILLLESWKIWCFFFQGYSMGFCDFQWVFLANRWHLGLFENGHVKKHWCLGLPWFTTIHWDFNGFAWNRWFFRQSCKFLSDSFCCLESPTFKIRHFLVVRKFQFRADQDLILIGKNPHFLLTSSILCVN